MSTTDPSDSAVGSLSAIETASPLDTDLHPVAVKNDYPAAEAESRAVASTLEVADSTKGQAIPRVLDIEEVEEVDEANVFATDINSSSSQPAIGDSTDGTTKADSPPPPTTVETAATLPPSEVSASSVSNTSSSEEGSVPTPPGSPATSVTFEVSSSSNGDKGGGGATQSEQGSSCGASSGDAMARRSSAPAAFVQKSILKKQSSLPPGAAFTGSSSTSRPSPLQRMASAPTLDSAAMKSAADRTAPLAPEASPRRQSRRISFSTELDMGVALDKGERYRCRYSCGFVGYMEEVMNETECRENSNTDRRRRDHSRTF